MEQIFETMPKQFVKDVVHKWLKDMTEGETGYITMGAICIDQDMKVYAYEDVKVMPGTDLARQIRIERKDDGFHIYLHGFQHQWEPMENITIACVQIVGIHV